MPASYRIIRLTRTTRHGGDEDRLEVDFASLVEEAMKDGWELVGGLQVNESPAGSFLAITLRQAVRKDA